MNLIRSDHRFNDRRIARRECCCVVQLRHWVAFCNLLVAARNEDPTFGSIEFDAVRIFATYTHLGSVGIQRLGLEWSMNIPQPVIWKLGVTPDLDWPGILRIHSPMRTVDVVCSPSRDHACAKLPAA